MTLFRTSVLMVAGMCLIADAGDVRRLDAHDLAPIILMQGQDIVACGVGARFGGSPDIFEMELALRKGPSGRRLRLRLSAPAPIADFTIEAGAETPDPFAKVTIDGLVAEQEIDSAGPGVTEFLRDFFVQGRDFSVRLADGRAFGLTIPGPISNSVRAAYLGCAGDFDR